MFIKFIGRTQKKNNNNREGTEKTWTKKIVRRRRQSRRSKCRSYLSVDCAVFKIVPAHYHLSLGWKNICSWLPWWCQKHSSGSPFSLNALQCFLSQNGQSFWPYLSFVFVTDLTVHEEAAQRNSPLAILYMKDEHSFFQPVHREGGGGEGGGGGFQHESKAARISWSVNL